MHEKINITLSFRQPPSDYTPLKWSEWILPVKNSVVLSITAEGVAKLSCSDVKNWELTMVEKENAKHKIYCYKYTTNLI